MADRVLASRRTGPRPGTSIHPGAWWAWALALAVAAACTTNPLVLVLIAAAALTVCLALRSDAPWALSLRLYLVIAGLVVVLRLGFRVLFGAGTAGSGAVAVSLPVLRLPAIGGGDGLALLGPVTWDSLYGGLMDGLRLGCLILCVGVANCLASPKKTLAALPAALRHVGTAVVVALSLFPSLALSVQRVRRAQALRAQAGPAVKVSARTRLRRIVFPVLADGLDRALELAASLESRGYGSTPPSRKVNSAAISPSAKSVYAGQSVGAVGAGHGIDLSRGSLAALVGCAALGGGGVMAASGRAATAGWIAVAAGALLIGLSFRLMGRSSRRTRYWRQPWTWRDWSVTLSGLGLGLGLWLTSALVPGALHPSTLGWPPLPWPAVVGWGMALLPLAIGLGAARVTLPATPHRQAVAA
ncbi:MAG: energy-coupling factor transporter transmembrane protein EcfT [Bifidobacteriaceae bacterium]|jgi:energy-coupling factor transport system permease protein|nr:energy-coupling factor transporter transmembrane protein EcfT [Bifidobacteriaceae bacterium]